MYTVHCCQENKGDGPAPTISCVQGQVFIKGKARHGLLSDDPEIGKLLNVGMVFQNGALFDSLTVGQNVGFLLYEHTKLPHTKIQVSLLACLVILTDSSLHHILKCIKGMEMGRRWSCLSMALYWTHSSECNQTR